jgi:hypothetical protein
MSLDVRLWAAPVELMGQDTGAHAAASADCTTFLMGIFRPPSESRVNADRGRIGERTRGLGFHNRVFSPSPETRTRFLALIFHCSPFFDRRHAVCWPEDPFATLLVEPMWKVLKASRPGSAVALHRQPGSYRTTSCPREFCSATGSSLSYTGNVTRAAAACTGTTAKTATNSIVTPKELTYLWA